MEYSLENIEQSIRQYKPNLKDGSVKFYLTSIRRAREINGSDDLSFIKEPKLVDKMLTEHIPLGSKEAMKYTSVRNTLIPIAVYLESINKDHQYNDIIHEYKETINNYNKRYATDQKDGKLKGRQVANMITREELDTLIKTLDKHVAMYKKKKEVLKLNTKELSDIRAWMLFHILKDIPTRLDYNQMKLINQRDYNVLKKKNELTDNYLVSSRGSYKFSFNDYKTNKVYGENVIEVDKPLKMKLNLYLKLNDYKVGDIIFPITRNAMSNLLTKTSDKIIKKKVSVQILRKFYVSEKYGGVNQEQLKDAEMMAHDIAVQQKVYNKNI
jgi:hypothetical protein